MKEDPRTRVPSAPVDSDGSTPRNDNGNVTRQHALRADIYLESIGGRTNERSDGCDARFPEFVESIPRARGGETSPRTGKIISSYIPAAVIEARPPNKAPSILPPFDSSRLSLGFGQLYGGYCIYTLVIARGNGAVPRGAARAIAVQRVRSRALKLIPNSNVLRRGRAADTK